MNFITDIYFKYTKQFHYPQEDAKNKTTVYLYNF